MNKLTRIWVISTENVADAQTLLNDKFHIRAKTKCIAINGLDRVALIFDTSLKTYALIMIAMASKNIEYDEVTIK